jgi:hypothetical protein
MTRKIFMSIACRVLMLGMVLALGTMVTGCPQSEDPVLPSSAKTVTVTGLGTYNGKEMFIALCESNDDFDDAVNYAPWGAEGTITGGSSGPLALGSMDRDEPIEPWTGSGSYYVALVIGDWEAAFMSKSEISFDSASTPISYSSGTFDTIDISGD